MALVFYNTLTKKKDRFRPVAKGRVGIYNCGPTVYDYAHIGNMRAYVFTDLLRRYLEYRGFKVKQVMNITDVDDKTIRNSRKQGVSLKDFTKRYEKAFFEDIKELNINKAHVYPHATEYIKDMIRFVRTLLDRGCAYKGSDGVYFKISGFRNYGRLSGTKIRGLKAGARVSQDEYDKEQANDFALWKFWSEEDGDIFWETGDRNIEKGRPGWHIECSVMSMKNLGKTIDIHTGGVDLIFPHHENEIAQSEAASGKRFVNYWLHNEHLLVDNKKMSKSLGNFYTLRDLLKRGFDPMSIRYVLLSTHYRQKLNFSEQSIMQAGLSISRLKEAVNALKRGSDSRESEALAKKARVDFEKAMDDDLNVPLALAVVFGFVREINKTGGGEKALETLLGFDRVLGLGLAGAEQWLPAEKADKEIREMIERREALRREKKWKEADAIRDRLNEMGIALQDTEKGVRWKRG